MEDKELRFCFNIDVTEDEFYQNNEVETHSLLLNYSKWGKWLHAMTLEMKSLKYFNLSKL